MQLYSKNIQQENALTKEFKKYTFEIWFLGM